MCVCVRVCAHVCVCACVVCVYVCVRMYMCMRVWVVKCVGDMWMPKCFDVQYIHKLAVRVCVRIHDNCCLYLLMCGVVECVHTCSLYNVIHKARQV